MRVKSKSLSINIFIELKIGKNVMNAKMCQKCVKNVNDKYYKVKKGHKTMNEFLTHFSVHDTLTDF